MSYDYPYHIQEVLRDDGHRLRVYFEVRRSDDGIICTGDNYMKLRQLIEAANTAYALENGDRGR
jgi:hypothetical protein